VPSVFYPQCDHLAVLLAEGHTLEGIVRDREGRAMCQVHYLQTGVEDGLTATQEPPPGSTVEGNDLEAVSQAEFTCAIAPCPESYEIMSLPMFCLAVAESRVNHTCSHRRRFAAPSSPLGVSLLEAHKAGFELSATLMVEVAPSMAETVAITVDTPVQASLTLFDSASPVAAVVPEAIAGWPKAHATSEALSQSQAFGKRLFRAWRSLALEKAKGDETPWNCYVEIENIYRQAFCTMQGTTFLSYMADLEGKEVSFGGVLQFNPLDRDQEGIEINGRWVSTLTFTLVRGALIPGALQMMPSTVTVNPEASDTANSGQFENAVTQVERQGNGLTLKLQRLCNKLMPRACFPLSKFSENPPPRASR
jgi:hypothetical protein